VLVRVDAYWPLKGKHRAALEERAIRVGAILERECEIEFGPVDLRAHA
jgi:hypothetical protein